MFVFFLSNDISILCSYVRVPNMLRNLCIYRQRYILYILKNKKVIFFFFNYIRNFPLRKIIIFTQSRGKYNFSYNMTCIPKHTHNLRHDHPKTKQKKNYHKLDRFYSSLSTHLNLIIHQKKIITKKKSKDHVLFYV